MNPSFIHLLKRFPPCKISPRSGMLSLISFFRFFFSRSLNWRVQRLLFSNCIYELPNGNFPGQKCHLFRKKFYWRSFLGVTVQEEIIQGKMFARKSVGVKCPGGNFMRVNCTEIIFQGENIQG